MSIGRMDWATPLGETRVVSKVVNPSWYPPASIRAEHAADGDPLPTVVPPGPKNPLGNRAMRLGLPGYLIHGTNRPAGVGMRVTHGCVRMFPEDIEFLFGLIPVDTRVRIINEPIKMGWDGDQLYIEVHQPLEVAEVEPELPPDGEVVVAIDDLDEKPVEETTEVPVRDPLTSITQQFVAATASRPGELDWDLAERHLGAATGVPQEVGRAIKNAATSAASE